MADSGFELLLLGLLKNQSQHGYSLLESVDKNAGALLGLSRATAYQVLRRLERQGWAISATEQVGNRPPRRVYSITAEGEARFVDMLRAGLAAGPPGPPQADVALMFMDQLSKQERLTALRARLRGAEAHARRLREAPSHGAGSSVDDAIANMRAHAETEVQWLRALVDALENPPKGASADVRVDQPPGGTRRRQRPAH